MLADHLLERGDPRGEFIALQLEKQRRPLSSTGARREKQLLHTHRAAWLGPLQKMLVGEEKWARGFLSEAWVKLNGATAGDPRWNTVEKINLSVADSTTPSELGGGNFRALHTLHGAFRLGLEVLLKTEHRPPLEELELSGPGSQSGWNRQQLAALLKMTAYPTLTRLKLSPALWPWEARQLQWLWGSALARQLHSLELDLNLPLDVAGCLHAAAQLPGLQRLVVGHSFFYFELTRGLDGRLSALHLHFSAVTQNASYLPQLSTPLRALPDDALTAFAFTTEGKRFPPAKMKPLRNAMSRQRLLKDERW
ncbi:MAG: hypothetical protein H6Q89_200 [Myxococcaceae bacterium]|nr:hypothetical protein [Myxococcaceae bacterium]